MHDDIIKIILNLNNITVVRPSYNYLFNKLKILGTKEELEIKQGFISRLKHRIYSLYIDSDFKIYIS